MRNRVIFALLSFCLLLSGCGMSSGSSQTSQPNYKDMKSMVLDILKTEDAQAALQESMTKSSGYAMQSGTLLNAQDQEMIKLAVKEVISAPEYDKVIKALMTDAKFAGEFAKAVNENNKALHEQLIKDPQYQEGLIAAFQTEDMKKVILDALKTADYRKELMSLMQDSLKNPIFRMELLELMQQAVSNELSPSEQSGEGGKGGDDSKGGDSKGGDSKSSSGGGPGGGK